MARTILLVDDVKLFLEVETGFLRSSLVTVLTAGNGLEALVIAKSSRPDLIIMDLHMPVMDGAECCAAIKDDPELRSIPVILVVTAGKPLEEEFCRRAGCDAILAKPIDRREFLALGRSFIPAIDRREMRAPCRSLIVCRINGETYHGTSEDLSAHGIYVGGVNSPVEVGDQVEVNFLMPESNIDLVEAWGRVAWVNQGSGRPQQNFPDGFGLEFLMMTEDSVGLIKNYLQEHAAGERLFGLFQKFRRQA